MIYLKEVMGFLLRDVELCWLWCFCSKTYLEKPLKNEILDSNRVGSNQILMQSSPLIKKEVTVRFLLWVETQLKFQLKYFKIL